MAKVGNVSVISGSQKPLKFEQIVLTTTAQHLNPPANATLARVDCEIGNARWRDDGAAPTAAEGMRWLADTSNDYPGDLSAIQIVLEQAGSIINVSYY